MKPLPFVIGQWVRAERFYGRHALIDEILRGPRNAIWLLGTRRIGKTSLLKQLEYLTSGSREYGLFPLFWDFQGADEPTELHAGFSEALFDSEDRLAALELSVESIDAGDLFVSLARLRRGLRARELGLLLLCDEVEELVKLHQKDPALLRKLRHALQASEDVRSVLASTVRLWALAEQRDDTSPFLHGISPPLYINKLADDEAEALILQTQLALRDRPNLPAAEVETIRRQCDNHPYLLQIVCKRRLEAGSLDDAVEQVATDSMVSYFFSVDFEMLSREERDLLCLLARQVVSSTEADLDKVASHGAVQRLVNLGLLRHDGGGRLELANYFFRRWLTDLAPSVEHHTPLLDSNTHLSGSPENRLLTAPAVIEDRYELRREVGEGATGIVYEAYDRLLRSRVAVKLLRGEFAGNRALLERFRKEILLSRNLGHPNILRVYHLGLIGERAYLIMQWVQGETLARRLRDQGPLDEQQVTLIGARLASALAAAHAHGVLHRDIKPHNIMMDKSGEPLITDFGLARLLEDPRHTTTGMFLGTPTYVSPEQASLQPLDERSDLYSLGVVLYEMATARAPFLAETVGDVLEMHRTRAPADPRHFAPDLSPEMSGLLLRCLEKDPERRFASATDLLTALEDRLPQGGAPPHTAAVVSHLGAAHDEAPTSPEDLLPLVYDELRRLARGFLSRERPGHTLQPTALVHEAYLRLAEQTRVDWQGRTHFLAVGAKVMRRLLIDHARSRGRLKRGGAQQKVTLIEALAPALERNLDLDELLTLDRALEELAAVDPRQAQIVELRFFGGLTVAEVAEHLGVSKRTVEGEWAKARNWLRDRLAGPEPTP